VCVCVCVCMSAEKSAYFYNTKKKETSIMKEKRKSGLPLLLLRVCLPSKDKNRHDFLVFFFNLRLPLSLLFHSCSSSCCCPFPSRCVLLVFLNCLSYRHTHSFSLSCLHKYTHIICIITSLLLLFVRSFLFSLSLLALLCL